MMWIFAIGFIFSIIPIFTFKLEAVVGGFLHACWDGYFFLVLHSLFSMFNKERRQKMNLQQQNFNVKVDV